MLLKFITGLFCRDRGIHWSPKPKEVSKEMAVKWQKYTTAPYEVDNEWTKYS